VRDGSAQPLVRRAGEDRDLAEAGVADGDEPVGVEAVVGREHVDRTLQPPRPDGERSGRDVAFGRQRVDVGTDARVPDVLVVEVEVTAVEGGDGVAGLDDLGERPLAGELAASAVGVVGEQVRDGDALVVEDRVVAVEVGADEGGERSAARVRDRQEQPNRRQCVADGEVEFGERRGSVEGGRIGEAH